MRRFVVGSCFSVLSGVPLASAHAAQPAAIAASSQDRQAGQLAPRRVRVDPNTQAMFVYGGNTTREPVAAPVGTSTLTGRIGRTHSAPAGTSVTVGLNGKYEAKAALDPAGGFAIALPHGQWRVNHLTVEGIPDPPAGGFVLRSGFEPVLEPDKRYERMLAQPVGHEVDLGQGETRAAIDLTLVETIQLAWPGPGTTPPTTDGSVSIRWFAFVGAARYQVQLHEVCGAPDPRMQAFFIIPVAWRILRALELHVADFAPSPDPGSRHLYETRVFAFAADGRYLSESSSMFYLRDARIGDSGCLMKEPLRVSSARTDSAGATGRTA